MLGLGALVAATDDTRPTEDDKQRQKPLVLRVEIAPEDLGALATLTTAESEDPAYSAALAEREQAVAAAERELAIERAALASRIGDLERTLAEREAQLERADEDSGLTASERIRLAERHKAFEKDLQRRAEELDRREADMEVESASREADLELREDKVEQQRGELTDLEQRLARKEREMAGYVAQLQEALIRRDAVWLQADAQSIAH